MSMLAVLLAATIATDVNGLYVRDQRIVPSMSLAKIKSVFGVEDSKWRTQEGLYYGWDLKEGAELVVLVDDDGSLQEATARIEIGKKAPGKPIYAIHTYTGTKRKVSLGKTTMKDVRLWFGQSYESMNSKKLVPRKPDVIQYVPEGTYWYGWSYEFGEEAESTLQFLTWIWDKDLKQPQRWNDKQLVRVLIVNRRS